MIGRISQFVCNVRDLTDNTPVKITFPCSAKQYFHMPTLDSIRPGAMMDADWVILNLECGSVKIEFEDDDQCP